jgi:hypothetical protein
MVEVVEKAGEAAWKIQNLDDFERRLERAALQVGEEGEERQTAALIIYDVVLSSSGRPRDEVTAMVRRFRETFADEEEPLTIPRTSGLMNVGPDSWFFGDADLRVMTGRLLGQFQHRVAQYNYVDESEVLKRWANGYDTRLFVRRRIPGTEPIAGVVPGVDLMTLQRLRVAAGGNSMVPTEAARTALEALGYEPGADEYEVLERAETLALHLDLPAPIAAALLEGLARDGITDFPEPPAPTTEPTEEAGAEEGEAAAKPAEANREERRAAAEDPAKGDEPTRVQDPQAKDAPGVAEEDAPAQGPAAPRTAREDEPGTTSR